MENEPKITMCGNKNCQSGVINGVNPKICKKCNPKEPKTFDELFENTDIKPQIDEKGNKIWRFKSNS